MLQENSDLGRSGVCQKGINYDIKFYCFLVKIAHFNLIQNKKGWVEFNCTKIMIDGLG